MATRMMVLLLGMVLGGCAGNGGTTIEPDTEWEMTSLAGSPPVAGSRVTIKIDVTAGRLGGSTGCNTYSAPFSGDLAAPAVGPIAATKRACVEPDRQAQERRFLDVMAQMRRIVPEGEDALVIETASGALAFQRAGG